MNLSLKNIFLIASLSLNVLASKYFYDTRSSSSAKQEQQVSKSVEQFTEVKEEIIPSLVKEKIDLKPLVKKETKKPRLTSKLHKKLIVINNERYFINYSDTYFETENLPETTQNGFAESISNVQNMNINSESSIVTDSDIDFPIVNQPIENQVVESNIVLNKEVQTEVVTPAVEIKEASPIANTISESVSFRVNLKDETNVKVVWADQHGKVMTVSNSTLDKGIQKLSLNTSDITSGTYTIDIVDISTNNTLKSVRFVKL